MEAHVQTRGRDVKSRLFYSMDILVDAKKLDYNTALRLHIMISGKDIELIQLGVKLIYGIWKKAAEEGIPYRGPINPHTGERGVYFENPKRSKVT